MKQLFKYLPEPRDLFEEGFIRLSQSVVLNDPFEASFCSESLDELTSHFEDRTALDSEYEDISFSEFVKMRKNNIGVISFTENKENLLMWSHYANDHKGVVAGISYLPMFGSIFQNLLSSDALLDTTSCGKYSRFDGIPRPVSYRKGLRYKNDKFDNDYSCISEEGADRILYEVFMRKSDEWIYEQEHRVVLRLEQSDRVIIENVLHIENDLIKDMVIKSSYSIINPKDNSCTINLYEIKEESIRIAVAMQLVKLSQNPKSIYLMKLNPSCINNCLLGLNSNFDKEAVQGQFASSVGYLDIWKAVKNVDYYSLEFMQI